MDPQLRTQALARAAAEFPGDSPHRCPYGWRTATSWLGQARYLFHKGPTSAPVLIAEESTDTDTDTETDGQPVAADRQSR